MTNENGYLTYQGSSQAFGGFAYKTAEEMQEILEKLCDILLETPSNSVDAKIIKQKSWMRNSLVIGNIIRSLSKLCKA